MGRRCLFIDLILISPDAKTPDGFGELRTLPPIRDSARELIVHRVGAHVTRNAPLRLNLAELAGASVLSLRIGQDPERGMSSSEIDEFAAALGDPSGLTKPRIGDIFAVEARSLTRDPKLINGAQLYRGDARAISLIWRGPVARPGDFDQKWNAPVGELVPRVARVGHPRRTKGRFRALAEFCEKSFPIGRDSIVLDVAGGAGRFAAQIMSKTSCLSIVVDPRGDEASLRDDSPDEEQPLPPPACAEATTDTELARITNGVVQHRGAAVGDPLFLKAFFTPSLILSLDGWVPSLLVGLHCDGAVDAILDAACQGPCLSFVIVSCCVFPRSFPRQLQGGRAVISRDDLNEWILEQAAQRGYPGRLWKHTLPFPGANVAVCGRVDAVAE